MNDENKNQHSGLFTAVKAGSGILATAATLFGIKVLYDHKDGLQDNINSNHGIPALIVGTSAVGKSTLIDYLHPGSTEIDISEYQRTQPPGRTISDFKAPTGKRNVRLELKKDVPGESFELWRSLIRSNRPEGIAFLISHQDDMVSKDEHIIAWNRLLDILKEEENLPITSNLKALHVFVNKIDLWYFEGITKNKIDEARRDIKQDFTKQILATKSLSDRYGFDFNDEMHLMSLLDDNNVQKSFNMFIEKVLEGKRYV